MFTYHIVGTLTIPDGAILGDARLWVNRTVQSVWSRDQALETALAATCRLHEADPTDAHWNDDLHIIPIADADSPTRRHWRRRATRLPRRPQPPQPINGAAVAIYLGQLEEYVSALEQLLLEEPGGVP